MQCSPNTQSIRLVLTTFPTNSPAESGRPLPRLKMIKLVVQIFQQVLHLLLGELRVGPVRAAGDLLLQSIERLNRSVGARQHAGVVAARAVGVEQAHAVGAVARQ